MRSDDPIDDISGTYGLTAALDSYAVMRHHDDGAVLHAGGRLWMIDANKFELRRGSQRWELLGEFSGLSPVLKDTLEALRGSRGMGVTDCANHWNIAKSTASERLDKLVQAGVARKSKSGTYYVV